jgi:preprotein translocase subunit SecF
MLAVRAIASRFYRGEANVDFVGRPKLWYSLSALLLFVSIAGLLIRGLNFGVEFEGGAVFTFKAPNASVEQVRTAVEAAGAEQAIVQESGQNGWRAVTETMSSAEIAEVQKSIAERFSIDENQVNTQATGPSWGGDISQKALIGLLVFLVAIGLYLSVAFELRMAAAASVALIHDLVITAGIYAWSGFEVTPATVLGFLTILGYSLYDAVVVFDMIKEVTARLSGGAKMTYGQAANQALNQTLVRSLNTSLVALLPVASILFIGTTLLGAGTLKDLSLVLFVGMLVGTYSSLCIATPFLVDLKEREPQYKALARRVAAREAKEKAEKSGKGSGKAAEGKGRRSRATAAREADDAGSGDVLTTTDAEGAEAGSGGESTADDGRAPVAAGSRRRSGQRGERQQPRRGTKRQSSGKKRKR